MKRRRAISALRSPSSTAPDDVGLAAGDTARREPLAHVLEGERRLDLQRENGDVVLLVVGEARDRGFESAAVGEGGAPPFARGGARSQARDPGRERGLAAVPRDDDERAAGREQRRGGPVRVEDGARRPHEENRRGRGLGRALQPAPRGRMNLGLGRALEELGEKRPEDLEPQDLRLRPRPPGPAGRA